MKTGLTNVKFNGKRYFDVTINFMPVIKEGAALGFNTMAVVPRELAESIVMTLAWREASL